MIGKVFQASCLAALLSLSVWGCTGEIGDAEYTSFGSDVIGSVSGATGVGAQAGAGGSSHGNSGSGGSGQPIGPGGVGGLDGSGGSGSNVAQGGADNFGGSGGESQAGGFGGTGGTEPQGGTGGISDGPSCPNACTVEDEKSCSGNAAVACKRAQNGCLAWQTQETCGANTSCNAGDCTPVNNCTNECTSGSTLCNGTITCTNNDSDPCLEWSAPPVCPTPTGPCKRGVASNVAPNASFAKGLSWWYNWASGTNSNTGAIEFAPMIWDERNVNDTIPAGSKYVLGFNEPNRFDQADLSATQAIALWPKVETIAASRGAKIVSTAMSYCGSVQNPAGCHEVSPYDYLTDFFAACPSCKVDYVAVHWYNCDVPSLKSYIEGFYKFNKPIWLTEFACAIGSDTSAAAQQKYMADAVEYLETNTHVFRYSWFSADPIPQAKLVNNDGSPTTLGNTYINLPNHCQ